MNIDLSDLLSLIGLALGALAFVEIKAMKKSSHIVQYVDPFQQNKIIPEEKQDLVHDDELIKKAFLDQKKFAYNGNLNNEII